MIGGRFSFFCYTRHCNRGNYNRAVADWPIGIPGNFPVGPKVMVFTLIPLTTFWD